MDKREHGDLLKVAISRKRLDRTAVADHVGVKPRTITNWTSGSTMPSEAEREALRDLLGDYDQAGDEVELAVRRSSLVKWRQNKVLGEYERHLYEQEREGTG